MQRVWVEVPSPPRRLGQVVDAAVGLHSRQKPQALLCERERNALGTLGRHERKLSLDGLFFGSVRIEAFAGSKQGDARCELRQRARLEQRTDRQLDIEKPACARGYLSRK